MGIQVLPKEEQYVFYNQGEPYLKKTNYSPMKGELYNLWTLTGDIVGSRKHPDGVQLHKSFVETLEVEGRKLYKRDSKYGLKVLVGDACRGLFKTEYAVMRASLYLRLLLLEKENHDLRFSLGFGTVFPYSPRPELIGPQTGQAWWQSMDGMNILNKKSKEKNCEYMRTYFLIDENCPLPLQKQKQIKARLLQRDYLVDKLNPRQRKVLRLALENKSREEINAEITQRKVTNALKDPLLSSLLISETDYNL